MKKTLLLMLVFAGLLSPGLVKAQTPTFTVAHDTIYLPDYLVNGGLCITPDPITNTTATAGLVLKWHVIACNFPPSWQTAAAFGLCDNVTCYTDHESALWNGTSGTTFTTNPYPYEVQGNYNIDLDLPNTAAAGVYYVTIQALDPASGYATTFTYVIGNTVTAVANVFNPNDDVSLYPNPASNEINAVWDANTDVKNIAIYNIIGKVMTTYRVAGNSANLNLDNIPSGIYLVRLINSRGDAVVTRKFTKR